MTPSTRLRCWSAPPPPTEESLLQCSALGPRSPNSINSPPQRIASTPPPCASPSLIMLGGFERSPATPHTPLNQVSGLAHSGPTDSPSRKSWGSSSNDDSGQENQVPCETHPKSTNVPTMLCVAPPPAQQTTTSIGGPRFTSPSTALHGAKVRRIQAYLGELDCHGYARTQGSKASAPATPLTASGSPHPVSTTGTDSCGTRWDSIFEMEDETQPPSNLQPTTNVVPSGATGTSDGGTPRPCLMKQVDISARCEPCSQQAEVVNVSFVEQEDIVFTCPSSLTCSSIATATTHCLTEATRFLHGGISGNVTPTATPGVPLGVGSCYRSPTAAVAVDTASNASLWQKSRSLRAGSSIDGLAAPPSGFLGQTPVPVNTRAVTSLQATLAVSHVSVHNTTLSAVSSVSTVFEGRDSDLSVATWSTPRPKDQASSHKSAMGVQPLTGSTSLLDSITPSKSGAPSFMATTLTASSYTARHGDCDGSPARYGTPRSAGTPSAGTNNSWTPGTTSTRPQPGSDEGDVNTTTGCTVDSAGTPVPPLADERLRSGNRQCALSAVDDLGNAPTAMHDDEEIFAFEH